MTKECIKFLILEDNEYDYELVERNLRKVFTDCIFKRATCEEEFKGYLNTYRPNIILSDYNIPSYSGIDALSLANSVTPEVPFIFVSGTIGEEKAVELLKMGAVDYVLKDSIFKLESAVKRAIAIKKAEERLRLLESVITNSNDAIIITDVPSYSHPEVKILYVNPSFLTLTGYSENEIVGKKLKEFVGVETESNMREHFNDVINTESFTEEIIKIKKNGSAYTAQLQAFPINNGGELANLVIILKDITHTKSIQNELDLTLKQLKFHIENTNLATIQLGSNLKISGWSKKAEKLFDRSQMEVMGKSLQGSNLILPDDLPHVESYFKETLKLQKSLSYDFSCRIISSNGNIIYSEWYCSALFAEDGTFKSLLILIKDNTLSKIEERALVEGQEQERNRIAREIHDGIGQMLIATKYRIANLESKSDPELQEELNAIEELVGKTIQEARSVLKNLAPKSIEELGLEVSLRNLCEQIKSLTGLNIYFQYIKESNLSKKEILTAIYRITQEALNNIVKHAGASNVRIIINHMPNNINVLIEDDGKGFYLNNKMIGNGLRNIKERAELHKGHVQIYSDGNNGCKITAVIPLI